MTIDQRARQIGIVQILVDINAIEAPDIEGVYIDTSFRRCNRRDRWMAERKDEVQDSTASRRVRGPGPSARESTWETNSPPLVLRKGLQRVRAGWEE